mgnify:CR=1 FL=1
MREILDERLSVEGAGFTIADGVSEDVEEPFLAVKDVYRYMLKMI